MRKISYQEIDFGKYSRCIENSIQRNFYARKEILDALCKHWEIVVLGDYEYCMPVPFVKKALKKIILMPLFCQQLGVFGKENSVEINGRFFDFVKKNYAVYFYSFNSKNNFNTVLNKRKNYFLENINPEFRRKKYSKGRKSLLKPNDFQFKNIDFEQFSQFAVLQAKGLEKENDMQKFISYVKFLLDKKLISLTAVFDSEELLSAAATVITPERNYLLALINNEQFSKKNGASYLVDFILTKSSGKDFDFSGGNMRNIEIFFKSFGAEVEEYPILQNNKVKLLRDLILKW